MAEFNTHGNGNGLNDLYILPASLAEASTITLLLALQGRSFSWSYANVPGHAWYGKRFIEVPFGEALQSELSVALVG
jgi:hypothetical protein